MPSGSQLRNSSGENASAGGEQGLTIEEQREVLKKFAKAIPGDGVDISDLQKVSFYTQETMWRENKGTYTVIGHYSASLLRSYYESEMKKPKGERKSYLDAAEKSKERVV